MLTNSKLVKALVLATVFGMGGTIHAAVIPSSEGTMITQQKNKVTGSVVDEMGPVAGASISVKGTSNGTITDQDGLLCFRWSTKRSGIGYFVCRNGYTADYLGWT